MCAERRFAFDIIYICFEIFVLIKMWFAEQTEDKNDHNK